MNICCVCQADGVLEVVGAWYCVDHLEEALLAVADYVARARGWDVDDTRTAFSAWLDE